MRTLPVALHMATNNADRRLNLISLTFIFWFNKSDEYLWKKYNFSQVWHDLSPFLIRNLSPQVGNHYSKASEKIAGSIPDEIIGFFNRPIPSSRIMALGSTQPLTEMSTRNPPGGKRRPERKADNLTAICEPIF
jgi:hypothetical protein